MGGSDSVIVNPKRKLIETLFAPLAKHLGSLGISYWWAVLIFCLVVLLFARRRIMDLRKQNLNFIVAFIGVLLVSAVALVFACIDQLGFLRGSSLYRGVAP
jgi:uncharacterized membrane protein YjjP (DUF1212 family)